MIIRIVLKLLSKLIIIYRSKNFTKTSAYDNSSMYKLKFNCDTFYFSKKNKNFKSKYKHYVISETKLKRTILSSNVLDKF